MDKTGKENKACLSLHSLFKISMYYLGFWSERTADSQLSASYDHLTLTIFQQQSIIALGLHIVRMTMNINLCVCYTLFCNVHI